jgi:hypothetical protein
MSQVKDKDEEEAKLAEELRLKAEVDKLAEEQRLRDEAAKVTEKKEVPKENPNHQEEMTRTPPPTLNLLNHHLQHHNLHMTNQLRNHQLHLS